MASGKKRAWAEEEDEDSDERALETPRKGIVKRARLVRPPADDPPLPELIFDSEEDDNARAGPSRSALLIPPTQEPAGTPPSAATLVDPSGDLQPLHSGLMGQRERATASQSTDLGVPIDLDVPADQCQYETTQTQAGEEDPTLIFDYAPIPSPFRYSPSRRPLYPSPSTPSRRRRTSLGSFPSLRSLAYVINTTTSTPHSTYTFPSSPSNRSMMGSGQGMKRTRSSDSSDISTGRDAQRRWRPSQSPWDDGARRAMEDVGHEDEADFDDDHFDEEYFDDEEYADEEFQIEHEAVLGSFDPSSRPFEFPRRGRLPNTDAPDPFYRFPHRPDPSRRATIRDYLDGINVTANDMSDLSPRTRSPGPDGPQDPLTLIQEPQVSERLLGPIVLGATTGETRRYAPFIPRNSAAHHRLTHRETSPLVQDPQVGRSTPPLMCRDLSPRSQEPRIQPIFQIRPVSRGVSPFTQDPTTRTLNQHMPRRESSALSQDPPRGPEAGSVAPVSSQGSTTAARSNGKVRADPLQPRKTYPAPRSPRISP